MTIETCRGCGREVSNFWIKYGLCHECHFKGDPTIPERIQRIAERAAREIDRHAKIELEHFGERCPMCLYTAWFAFADIRSVLGMGDTWAAYQATHPNAAKKA